jgi:hypothetical protein
MRIKTSVFANQSEVLISMHQNHIGANENMQYAIRFTGKN